MTEAPLIPAARLLRYECPEDRALMPERASGHHCAACDKTVVDMARLTLLEAVEAVRAAPAGTCSSYVLRDGALVFRAARRTGGSVVISIAAFLAACQSGAPSHEAVALAFKTAASAAAAPSAAPSPAAPSTALNVIPLETAVANPVAPPSSARCAVAKLQGTSGASPSGPKAVPRKRRDTVLMGY